MKIICNNFENFIKFNGENYTDNENLLLAVGPVISAAVVRVHTVDELIKLYEKHKVLKAKIPRFHFLNYNMGEEFQKSVMTIEKDLHFALGIGEHLERRLSATDLKNINFSLFKILLK